MQCFLFGDLEHPTSSAFKYEAYGPLIQTLNPFQASHQMAPHGYLDQNDIVDAQKGS
jgi:hypothetical protein